MSSTPEPVTGGILPMPHSVAWLKPCTPSEFAPHLSSEDLLAAIKTGIEQADAALAKHFWSNHPIVDLVNGRAWLVEQWLIAGWNILMSESPDLTLVAVGGFGRGELHPHSDIDLMILGRDRSLSDQSRNAIQDFITLLWDAGLYLGHSVRTLSQCETEAGNDVVTATNLMEARCVAGDESLFVEMKARTAAENIWPGPEFFKAKYQEQMERHARFNDTAYRLEPNIKEGPGGLRDIQMVAWVCKRAFRSDTLHGLVDHGVLSELEYAELQAGQHFLWRVRYALHLLSGRGEDRLLFEHQKEIASQQVFGRTEHCADGNVNESVEAFMQIYYRLVMKLERLNDTLLQALREQLLQPGRRGEPLGDWYVINGGYLDVRDPGLLARHPEIMLELFVLLARRPDIQGVRAGLIRLIRDNLHLIDDEFRNAPQTRAAFMKLLQQPEGVYSQLQRMNRYGVLAALIPAFAQITGRMQFDLFHVYTVDQHILFVVRNLRRFAYGKYAQEYPGMAALFQQVDKPELLYLAALFHDIAKGRDGDHSTLGAEDVRAFCKDLPIAENDANLVVWLVEQHLLMSQTAQRKDIADPEVVRVFAAQVGSKSRLNYLYLLTVADISATSPKLWNAWKAGLLKELYAGTAAMLEGTSDVGTTTLRANSRNVALEQLVAAGYSAQAADKFWQTLPVNAFQRLSADQLSWATTCVIQDQAADAGVSQAVVAVREVADLGISEIFVAAADYTGLFASTTAIFEEMHLNILSARVFTTVEGLSFDIFQVMNKQSRPLSPHDAESLAEKLGDVLTRKALIEPPDNALPRRLRPFVIKPQIAFGTGRGGTVNELEVVCSDRPGILSRLAWVLASNNVRLHDALIATFGERVEDTFLISDRQNRLLTEDQKDLLAEAIRQELDQPANSVAGP